MRIISQDGNVDLPYENFAISTGYRGDLKEYYIFANFVNCSDGKPQILATYSTEAKAQKAIEMLREFYTCCDFNNRVFQFPNDEDLEVQYEQ